MTRRFGGVFAVPFLAALAMLLAPPAWADTYTDQVVDRFGAMALPLIGAPLVLLALLVWRTVPHGREG